MTVDSCGLYIFIYIYEILGYNILSELKRGFMHHKLSGLWKNKNTKGVFLFKQKNNNRDILVFGIGVGRDKFSNIGQGIIEDNIITFSWRDSYVSPNPENAVNHICKSEIKNNDNEICLIKEINNDKNSTIEFDYGNFERIFNESDLKNLLK